MEIGKFRGRRTALLAVALASVAWLAACDGERSFDHIGETKTETQQVKLNGAKSVDVDLKMGAGEMRIAGGAPDLMDGTFTFNVAHWEPRVDYHVSGERGSLVVEEPDTGHTHVGNTKNKWDIQLSNSVPMELHVEMGAGQSDLSLADLDLTRLHVECGAGQSTIDLTGDWSHDVDVHVQGGVGQATLRLPSRMGVRVTVSGGLGSVSASDFTKNDEGEYVNDQIGKAAHTVNVRVEGGVGNVTLELAGGPTV